MCQICYNDNTPKRLKIQAYSWEYEFNVYDIYQSQLMGWLFKANYTGNRMRKGQLLKVY